MHGSQASRLGAGTDAGTFCLRGMLEEEELHGCSQKWIATCSLTNGYPLLMAPFQQQPQ